MATEYHTLHLDPYRNRYEWFQAAHAPEVAAWRLQITSTDLISVQTMEGRRMELLLPPLAMVCFALVPGVDYPVVGFSVLVAVTPVRRRGRVRRLLSRVAGWWRRSEWGH